MTHTTELEIAIRRADLTKREVARRLGISEMGLYKKIHNGSEFKASEIVALAKILGLGVRERDSIFFASQGD